MRTHAKASSNRGLFALGCLCVLGLTAFLGSGVPTVGAAESFPGQGFLPDNRAWEMVSPPDKHGGEVDAVSSSIRAGADGGAVAFASSIGFGDVQGTGARVEYIARRDAAPGTNGWSSHAITPRASPVTFETAIGEAYPGYQGDFSGDLSRGVFLSPRPLTEAPNSADLVNLYLGSDLTDPGSGSFSLLTDSLAPPQPELPPIFLLIFGKPGLIGASADFSHVAFESNVGLTEKIAVPTEKTPNPPYEEFAPFSFGEARKLYENAEGTVRLVGRVPAEPATACDDAGGSGNECEVAPTSQAGIENNPGAHRYSSHMISADGSRIFFQTPISFTGGKVYLREDGTRTFQLNASEKETPEAEPKSAELWDTSRDGSRAFFTTKEGLVEGDDDNGSDLYMYEVEKPEGERLTLISADHEPADGGGGQKVIGTSDDGRYVYFVGDGQLVKGGPLGIDGGLYLWHESEISYLGHFSSSTDSPGGDAHINSPRADLEFITHTKTSRVSPDGRHLLFMTRSDKGFKGIGGFAGYDHSDAACDYGGRGSCRELYLYDAASGNLRCASCNPSGATATADALDDVSAPSGPIVHNFHLSHALSDDGRYVFFSTAERLVPADTNGTWDAYVYDATSEEPHLLSSGQDKDPSYFLDASADGHDAFIITAERLSGWDNDTSYDLYDARVGGGLPEPVPPPPSCQGDACQPLPTQLNDPTPSSSSFQGAGNQKARKPHKHKRKKHHNRHSQKHKRTADNHRRAGR